MIGNHAPFSSKKERTPIFSIHLIFTGVNALIHAYYEAVVVWHGTCPICDRPLTKNGRYIRKTPREIGPFWVHLVSCPTRKHGSHALIPCFVLPYQQVLAEQQEFALVAMAERTHTVEQIAEELNVDTKTVYHWWSTFGRNTGIILNYLARLLAQLSELATWARRVGSATRSKVLTWATPTTQLYSHQHINSIHTRKCAGSRL